MVQLHTVSLIRLSWDQVVLSYCSHEIIYRGRSNQNPYCPGHIRRGSNVFFCPQTYKKRFKYSKNTRTEIQNWHYFADYSMLKQCSHYFLPRKKSCAIFQHVDRLCFFSASHFFISVGKWSQTKDGPRCSAVYVKCHRGAQVLKMHMPYN